MNPIEIIIRIFGPKKILSNPKKLKKYMKSIKKENKHKVPGIIIKSKIAKQKINNFEKLKIGIIIGPEGGFDKSDIEVLKQINSLGEIYYGKTRLR